MSSFVFYTGFERLGEDSLFPGSRVEGLAQNWDGGCERNSSDLDELNLDPVPCCVDFLKKKNVGGENRFRGCP